MARQRDLFDSAADCAGAPGPLPEGLPLLRHQLLSWRERVAAHQGPLFAAAGRAPQEPRQGLLFAVPEETSAPPDERPPAAADPQAWAAWLDPLALQPQSLSFWRWPTAPQQGAALYLVIDRPPGPSAPLLLYVGETGCADRRWKGDHDCKDYLAAYGEALRQVGLEACLSIRFWCDAPAAVRPRRALEQALIRRWLPPFNKETRARWATPFRAELA
ncbi:MAG: GIY-YIG nuclease family protein [Synechococcaceae cyanobacterium]|nr:GIY-YIG nuclease family protein [Synechococcaceae cyanobacterium]